MKKLIKEIVKWRISKGFITPPFYGNKDLLLGKLMLVVTEIAEMAEAVRKDDFNNFKEEMADVYIRLFDIAGASKIDVKSVIKKKMKINKMRPHLHGKVTHL